MKRLFAAAALSIALYVLVFGFMLDRPLSLGLLRLEILQKTARMSQLPSPKLIILAGSNAPYSHSCAIIGAMLKMPCENAGIAVGIGLDDLFARYAPYLHPGDIVYMPMETDQYIITRAANRAAPDAGFLLRHDRYLLTQLPTDRLLGAIFCCSLADLLESAAEMPIAEAGLIKPEAVLATQYNIFGDRINTTLATADHQLLNMPPGAAPTPNAIQNGYGSIMIATFVRQQTARGVTVIGGLPTEFLAVKLPPATIAAIQHIYQNNGGRFATLPNNSQYPSADFYDSKDHLAQPCQYANSIAVAQMLASILNHPVLKAAGKISVIAAKCPTQ